MSAHAVMAIAEGVVAENYLPRGQRAEKYFQEVASAMKKKYGVDPTELPR